MSRVLLLLPTTSYRAPDFIDAARRLGVELTVASEKKNVMASRNPDGYMALDFEHAEYSAEQVEKISRNSPFQAVLGVDDQTTILAAVIARTLALKSNPVESVEISRNKFKMRERLQQKGLAVPDYWLFPLEEDPVEVSGIVSYPCVLKPTMLAASQGVMRANDEKGFVSAWERLKRIINTENTAPEVLVESYIPGVEVALEGLLDNGVLRMLALFDKPDPLEGPFFEETIYVRPSRLSRQTQERVFDCAQKAISALGLTMGPVHAELRVNQEGTYVIEVAARPIGGRCSKALRFGLGVSLEEFILRQALDLETGALEPDPMPSGVMMIPIPKAGVLRQVNGLEAARVVPGIVEVLMMAHMGQKVVPLPEGARYFGFIFCRANTPELVEQRLRQAHGCLELVIDPFDDPARISAPGVASKAVGKRPRHLPLYPRIAKARTRCKANEALRQPHTWRA